ncbi:hypothetical protein RUM44_005766 [Polyplax serrata]|uniref:Uncharacterized protein n=1 Tax=Polyplax serrata TaxID=468196 RepID=A0ABR1AY08_POLSC
MKYGWSSGCSVSLMDLLIGASTFVAEQVGTITRHPRNMKVLTHVDPLRLLWNLTVYRAIPRKVSGSE